MVDRGGAPASAVRRGFSLEGRWIYSSRDEHYGPPYGPGDFSSLDRIAALEADVRIQPRLTARLGGLYDRVTVSQVGNTPFSWGSRTESRAYVGLYARFGRVTVSGVECIELDPEPYDVWFVHDKGFLHMQTTF